MGAWLSIGEAASRLGWPEQKVRRMAIAEEITSRLQGNQWEVSREAVEAFRSMGHRRISAGQSRTDSAVDNDDYDNEGDEGSE